MSVVAFVLHPPITLAMPRYWAGLSLARQFAVMALILSVLGTVALGAWVSTKIEQTARARAAGSAAIYIGHFVSPLLQEMADRGNLSQDRLSDLDAVMDQAALRLRIVGIKIWSTDGRIVYSTHREAIGAAYPIEGALARALEGTVASEFDSPSEESHAESAGETALLEVYAPIRSERTGGIIAVAEFYEKADDLYAHLNVAQIQSWLVTGLVLASLKLCFFSIVRDGSRTIEKQRVELTRRIAELSGAMADLGELRERIEQGARNVIEENERFLRMVGSELHDGPTQLISLALLRLDTVDEPREDVKAIRSALKDAMHDIRGISAGLLQPNMHDLSLADGVRATVHDHEVKTGTRVSVEMSALPADCPLYAKICVCRFIQEGLANAFWHAGAKGQAVLVEQNSNGIRAQVSDKGPGMSQVDGAGYGTRLGLIGLRSRLESIRGTFSITSQNGVGTVLCAWLPLEMSLSDGT